jgi:hypothetical protein
MLENLTNAQMKQLQDLYPVIFVEDDCDQESLESAAKFSGITTAEYQRKARAIRNEVKARGIGYMTMPEEIEHHAEIFASI